MALRELNDRQAVRGEPGTTGPLLIPERRRPAGPVTASRLRRTGLGLALVWAVGLLPIVLDAGPGWRAAGLGLLAPGAGFLYTSDPVFVALSLALFVLALFAWFGSGNVLAPPAVWLGSAGLAALRVHSGLWNWAEVAVPAGIAAVLVIGLAARSLAFRAALARRDERNAYLSRADWSRPRPAAVPPVGPELSADDLALQRFVLDLALQPVDRFDGFDWVDQFQTAAVRYQLNFAQYALALAQYTRTPAFTGYLSEAQRNLIQKMQDKRVWRYWRWENLWGNLGLDPDPIPRDNIMYSAYFGLMLGAYETVNVDDRYDRPGAVELVWDERRSFRYDHTSIAEAVHANFRRSPWGMFPCEPNWIYAACNTFGINCLLSHDRLHGTEFAGDVLDGFTHAVEVEFLTADGRVTAIRSSRFGLTIPSLTSTMADAGTALFLNPSLPDGARRSWLIVRNEFVHAGPDGVRLALRGWDKLDVGNYRPGDISPHAIVMSAALEMGDDEIHAAVRDAVDARFRPDSTTGGVLRYRGSTQANCMIALGRFGRRDGFRDLVTRGAPDAWRTGPVLAEAPYPDVLVVSAVTDGTALDLVLRPGGGGGRVVLGLERLAPARRYAVTGGVDADIVADELGRATVEVDLDDRAEVRIAPRV